jgi:hypothetical protein
VTNCSIIRVFSGKTFFVLTKSHLKTFVRRSKGEGGRRREEGEGRNEEKGGRRKEGEGGRRRKKGGEGRKEEKNLWLAFFALEENLFSSQSTSG